MGDIFSCDLLSAVLDFCDFADIAATLKDRKRLRDLALRRERYGFAKLLITLSANRVQAGNQHPHLLHLEDRPSSFDGVMLALVADEDDPLDAFLACFMEDPID